MSGLNFMRSHPIVAQTFRSKRQMSKSWWCKRKGQGTHHQSISKFFIFQNNRTCCATEKVRGSPKRLHITVGTMNIYVPGFVAINPVVIDTFHKNLQMSSWWWRYSKSGDHQSPVRLIFGGTWTPVQKCLSTISNSCWHIPVWTKVLERPTNKQTNPHCLL